MFEQSFTQRDTGGEVKPTAGLNVGANSTSPCWGQQIFLIWPHAGGGGGGGGGRVEAASQGVEKSAQSGSRVTELPPLRRAWHIKWHRTGRCGRRGAGDGRGRCGMHRAAASAACLLARAFYVRSRAPRSLGVQLLRQTHHERHTTPCARSRHGSGSAHHALDLRLHQAQVRQPPPSTQSAASLRRRHCRAARACASTAPQVLRGEREPAHLLPPSASAASSAPGGRWSRSHQARRCSGAVNAFGTLGKSLLYLETVVLRPAHRTRNVPMHRIAATGTC
mmetsp:Transcript_8861/g.20685  ORF Transcript_8861/g.20685 Transcript_8861/m.20685 type:complete len:279 (-) Transcript_8861:7-843(-)